MGGPAAEAGCIMVPWWCWSCRCGGMFGTGGQREEERLNGNSTSLAFHRISVNTGTHMTSTLLRDSPTPHNTPHFSHKCYSSASNTRTCCQLEEPARKPHLQRDRETHPQHYPMTFSSPCFSDNPFIYFLSLP
jgi:hypothetical protein